MGLPLLTTMQQTAAYKLEDLLFSRVGTLSAHKKEKGGRKAARK